MASVARCLGCVNGFTSLPSNIKNSTNTIRRWYQHSALKWARENPKIAQECLNLPPLPSREDYLQNNHRRNSLHSLKEIQSLDDYWKWRKWDFPVDSDAELVEAKALASHVLSAPLTLATQLLTNTTCSTMPRKHQWCCIGARAEASLPLDYWKEMLVLDSAIVNVENNENGTPTRPLQLTLDFIGPEIVQRPPVQQSFEQSTLTIRWLHAGKFHEYWAACQNLKDTTTASTSTSSTTTSPPQPFNYDAYILLNPGLGHAHLKEDWKPTLDLLLPRTTARKSSESESPTLKEQQRPAPKILLTAHSKLDAERDAALLAQEYPLCSQTMSTPLQYADNPFVSRIAYQDPFEAQHLVRPNHYLVSL
jgi:hypothetical protein